jgi:hypothetical protein
MTLLCKCKHGQLEQNTSTREKDFGTLEQHASIITALMHFTDDNSGVLQAETHLEVAVT